MLAVVPEKLPYDGSGQHQPLVRPREDDDCPSARVSALRWQKQTEAAAKISTEAGK